MVQFILLGFFYIYPHLPIAGPGPGVFPGEEASDGETGGSPASHADGTGGSLGEEAFLYVVLRTLLLFCCVPLPSFSPFHFNGSEM